MKLHDLLEEDPAFRGLRLYGCLTHCRRYYDRVEKFTELPSEQSLARVAIKDYLGPFAVGRRASLFADTQIGARASANFYTLAQTCRANGVPPVA